MQFGIILGNWGEFADADLLIEFGVETERAGWDGVFLADHLHYGNAMRLFDPWITLSGLARQTQSIKLGSWITPVPRRLPWQLARNLATLDHLSDGRVILGAGLGAPPDDYTDYGIEYDTTRLAKRFDESLDIIDGLWSDGPFSYEGEEFKITDVDLRPEPVQTPRIPIVTAGRWPSRSPIRRGARWDGIMPVGPEFPRPLSTDEVRKCVEYYHSQCDGEPGDVFLSYVPDSLPLDAFVDLCEQVGVTWVLVGAVPQRGSEEANLERIREGPPTVP